MGLTQRLLEPRRLRRKSGWGAAHRAACFALTLCFAAHGSLQAQEAKREDPSSDGAAVVRQREAAYEFTRAKLLSDTGQFEEALAAFRRSIELDGSDPYSLIELADFHAYLAQISRSERQQASHLQSAAEHAVRAREIAPDNVDVLRSYAQIQMRLVEQQDMDALARARGAFEELRERIEGDLFVLISLGQIYLWQREGAKAAEVLTEAASFRPHHPTIENLLVDAHLSTGELGQAEEVLAQIVARDPTATEQRLQLAELRGNRGDHRGAVEVLRGGPQTQFVNPRFRRLLARELHLSGDNEEALAITDTLLEEFPSGDGLRRLRVSILSALARYEQAVLELEPLIGPQAEDGADTEQSLQDELFLSRLLERIGRAGEAADKLRTLLERSSQAQALQVKMALVSLFERQGMVDEAVEIVSSEFERATPERAASLGGLLSQVLARHDRQDEALAVLDRLLAASEKAELTERLRLQKSGVLGDRGDWRRALDVAEGLLDSESPDVRAAAYLQVGEALSQLGQTERALAMLRQGQEALDASGLLAKRLEILFAASRDGEAETLLAEMARSDDAEDLLFVARAYQRAGRFEQAIPMFDRLLDQDPTAQPIRFALGASYERAGKRQQAISTFQDLLELSPDHAPALNYLGYMWAERGEHLDQALSLIQRAVALDPDNGAYVDSLGWTYYQLGRYQEARLHLEWAARLVPDDRTILEHLGDLYMRLQDLDRARDSYRQALDLGDGDGLDELRRKLETLEQKGL